MINALITVYNPTQEIIKNIKNISLQVDRLFVCDNSKIRLNANEINDPKIVYIYNDGNLGIPLAFNKVLQNNKYEWSDTDYIVFFDQDSKTKKDYIQLLISAYEKVEKRCGNIGCMGPIFYNTSNNTVEIPHIKKRIVENNYIVNNVITSSMICRYKNLKKVNFWNNELFLDFADWDLCWRMESKGLLCVITKEVVLNHSVGTGDKKIGFLRIRVAQPIREYYETRDALYLLKKKYVPLKMRFRLWINVHIRPFIHFLFLNQWKERKYYINKGRQDYKSGIHGEFT